jgi:hypothetical protein
MSRPAVSHLLYLHGFRSSPQSAKARIVAAWLARQRPEVVWHCPQLPPSPAAAMREVMAHTAGWPHDTMGVVGSSLGGFYATAVAERLGCRAVLLNPAIDPARDLARHVGEITAWHSDERFHFQAEFVDELRALSPTALTRPERYLAILAKGDELLDWREMAARYAGCPVKLLEGSDHALSDFELHLPDLLSFLGLA